MNSIKTSIICPKCRRLVTLTADLGSNLGEKINCPDCLADLPIQNHLQEGLADTFLSLLRQCPDPMLAEFGADWCPPCKLYEPMFKEASNLAFDQFNFIKINTEQNPSLAQSFEIKGLPTTILFSNGQELARKGGAMTSENLINWAQEICNNKK